MRRSGLLKAIGGFLTCLGLFYLVSPPPNPGTGEGAHDPYSLLMCVWFFASGVGIFAHRRWGFWTYIAGLLLVLTAGVVNGTRYDQPLSYTLQATLLMAAIFGLPALLIWLKRDRLEPGFWSAPSDASDVADVVRETAE